MREHPEIIALVPDRQFLHGMPLKQSTKAVGPDTLRDLDN